MLSEDTNNKSSKRLSQKTSMILAFVPIVVLAGMMIFLLSPYGQSLINVGTPLPQVTIEKVEFHDNQILAFIRNTGPLDIVVSQADVNDRIQSAAIEPSSKIPRLGEAHVMIPFPWIPGTPYEIGITTSDGTRFSKSVEAAAMAPNPDANQALLFTSLGVYVGVIPIMIGLLWYPYIRRISIGKYSFFLSLTAGLLVFLGIDALLEVNEIVIGNLASVFNGQALGILVTISSFVLLLYTSDRLTQRAIEKSVVSKTRSLASSTSVGESSSQEKSVIENQKGEIYSEPTKVSSSTREIQIQIRKYQELLKPLTISMMIAIGIGLHNFGEGLAIGAAMLLGEVALSTFLIVGFTLHNTTEGLAIVAPIAKSEVKRSMMIRRLILMGLIAGVPTIAGTWIGGFLYSPLAAVVFLSVGAGAIFQVVYSLISWISHHQRPKSSPYISGPVVAGFITGLLIMYFTGLLI
ncbi:MAG TPA: ZIP family metal transporter [Nitrososphaeraceae archaeon]|nr:ZIP family metal transporter [Nitrososphaeraceae archaeon]